MMRSLAFAAALAASTHATVYPLAQSAMGTTFFENWNLIAMPYEAYTNGNVSFATEDYIDAHNMASVNAAGQVYLSLDNSSYVPQGQNRSSIRLESKLALGVGSVLVFDGAHLPYGCGVWASFWTTGAAWPLEGELDIFEAVNLQVTNTFTLHTAGDSQCVQPDGVDQTGYIFSGFNNCSTVRKIQPQGCAIRAPDGLPTFGAAYAQQGGGVYAAEMAEDGIRMWFWSKNRVPANLKGNPQSIDTATWGTPIANFMPSCDIGTYFGYQKTVLDITMCGDYAGNPTVYAQTCADVAGGMCYNNVWGNGDNLNEAYFLINSIKWFSTNTSTETIIDTTGLPTIPAYASSTASSTLAPSTAAAVQTASVTTVNGLAAVPTNATVLAAKNAATSFALPSTFFGLLAVPLLAWTIL